MPVSDSALRIAIVGATSLRGKEVKAAAPAAAPAEASASEAAAKPAKGKAKAPVRKAA